MTSWWPLTLRAEVRDLAGQVDSLALDRDEVTTERNTLRAERDDLADQLARMTQSRDTFREQASSAKQAAREAFEPSQTPLCRKLRYLYREDAEGHAIHLLSRTGGPDVLNAYECRDCPAHPGYGTRWWHVGHCRRTDPGAITVTGVVANYRCGCVWGLRGASWLTFCSEHRDALDVAS